MSVADIAKYLPPSVTGQLASSGIPGADIAAGLLQASTPAPDPNKVATTYIQGYFNQSIPLWAHTLLTGVFPFAALIPLINSIPGLGVFYRAVAAVLSVFTALGANGANLLLSNSMAWAAAKFGSNQMLKGIYYLLSQMYPGQWWTPYLKSFLTYANPWVTFDIVQRYSPHFARDGYKLPVANMYLNSTIAANQATHAANQAMVDKLDEKGNVMLIVQQDEAGNLKYIAGSKKPACLPKVLTSYDIGFTKTPATDASGNPLKNSDGSPVYVTDPVTGQPLITYGQMSPALFGMMLLYIYPCFTEMMSMFPPEIQAMMNPWLSWAITATGAIMGLTATIAGGTILAVPGALGTVKKLFTSQAGGSEESVPEPVAPMTGGGKQTAGAKLPDINDVIQETLNNTKDEMPFLQGGGGALDTDESTVFLGSLTIASLVGIGLAVMRNKKLSSESV